MFVSTAIQAPALLVPPGVPGSPTQEGHGLGVCTHQQQSLLRAQCAARSYSGARTADAFLEFLEAKLEEDRGFARVESLDKLASAFMTATDKTGDVTHASSGDAAVLCRAFPSAFPWSYYCGTQRSFHLCLCMWHRSLATSAVSEGFNNAQPLLMLISICESWSRAATGASAALKAAAEKLDDVQRGAGELYAKFAEKASTKVRPFFAAVCPGSVLCPTDTTRWLRAMMASNINHRHRQASSFDSKSRGEACQPAMKLEQVLDCEA